MKKEGELKSNWKNEGELRLKWKKGGELRLNWKNVGGQNLAVNMRKTRPDQNGSKWK